jgi:hypothetical protein
MQLPPFRKVAIDEIPTLNPDSRFHFGIDVISQSGVVESLILAGRIIALA